MSDGERVVSLESQLGDAGGGLAFSEEVRLWPLALSDMKPDSLLRSTETLLFLNDFKTAVMALAGRRASESASQHSVTVSTSLVQF